VSGEGSVLAARAIVMMAGGAAHGPGVETGRGRLELPLEPEPKPVMKAGPPRLRPRARVDAAAWIGRMMAARVVMPMSRTRATRKGL
jgi:hypothetical protein